MSTLRVQAALIAVALALPAAAQADFTRVTERSEFMALVADRQLTRMGISVEVTRDGEIRGRAFGRMVSGAWDWQNGYFCRDLSWGEQELGYNCQSVARNGASLRFTSDRGAGQSANLQLE